MLLLCIQEKANLLNGNQCADACVRIIRECKAHKVNVVLENPRDSLLFHLPELSEVASYTEETPSLMGEQKLCLQGFQPYLDIVFDMCCFGTEWKKPTRLYVFGVPAKLAAPLNRKCKARRLLKGESLQCQHSGKPHVQLSGAGKGGFLTKKAAEYPLPFAQALAKALLQQEVGE